jgi:hypothetical protein
LSKVFSLACKNAFLHHSVPFFRAVALLCLSKNASIGTKMLFFRLQQKTLDNFTVIIRDWGTVANLIKKYRVLKYMHHIILADYFVQNDKWIAGRSLLQQNSYCRIFLC